MKNNDDIEKELKKFDEELGKKSINKLFRILKLVLVIILIIIWYYLIKGIETYFSNYKLFIILLYVAFIYLLFNILVFSNLQINYKVKPKTDAVRKDVKIFINISKILVFFNIILIILFSYFVYNQTNILTTMIYFLPLCGFNLIYYHLTFSLENVIIKHYKLDYTIIILGILFIFIGLVIYIYNPINIFSLITHL